jgi:hypothetical protein
VAIQRTIAMSSYGQDQGLIFLSLSLTPERYERDKRARFETFWQEYERQPRLNVSSIRCALALEKFLGQINGVITSFQLCD